jgi:hypothetical protein
MLRKPSVIAIDQIAEAARVGVQIAIDDRLGGIQPPSILDPMQPLAAIIPTDPGTTSGYTAC